MLEYPQQVVVEHRSLASGKKPSPLPADKKLETDRLYIMLPMKRGRPAELSAEEACLLLSRANMVLKSKSLITMTGVIPLFVRVCAGANDHGLGIVQQKKEKSGEVYPKAEIFSEFLDERPEFLSRQVSGKGWKPTLDTIKEKGVKTKVHHWLV
ncbi:hypothetical protein RJ640_020000 [Escallonia rubra]|uniref:Uncharacterized protein n=1 Tax=Escallonia rubra TaxID=112253 RepID=A0AA88QSG4_9ASTE|nr:hypothetical protein RJ640_020000 [Escallonia rubra]